MSTDVFAVHPNARLTGVAAKMAERKIGSAVVVDEGEVLGIFTAMDGLRVLASLTRERSRRVSTEY
jgi:CBS domain-containing protein